MFAFSRDLKKSWIKSRTRALWWYYTGRLHLRGREQAVHVAVQPGMATAKNFSITWITPDDARESLRMFSDNNPWLKYPLPKTVDTIVDLGANIGLSSLFWSMKYPQSTIYAVEMVKSNADRCKTLLESNRVHAQVIHAAVGATNGELQYQEHPSHTRCHLHEFESEPDANARLISVQAYSLKNLLHVHSISGVDLLKVDIEGAESYLLQTIDEWAPSVRCMLMELHHNIIHDDAVRQIEKAGFKIVQEDRRGRTELFCLKE